MTKSSKLKISVYRAYASIKPGLFYVHYTIL